MKDGLNRKYWDKCGNITGLWPSGAGALIFYQVFVDKMIIFMFTNQGLPINPHPLVTTDASSEQLANGTWTNGFGHLQSGNVDMWATDAIVTLNRYNEFLFTTPFTIEKYGALMKRQPHTFYIDVESITAGFDLSIYATLFAILTLLFLVCYINERFQSNGKRNSIWHILLSLFPLNGQMWPNQTGVTRKLLMATCGFGILILSSLYQAKYAEEQMIPYPPPEVTFNNIEYLASTGRAKLLFNNAKSSILAYLKNESTILAQSMLSNPPIYKTNNHLFDYMKLIETHNGIMIDVESVLLSRLSNVDPKSCSNYVLVTFEQWTRAYTALVMRKERVDMLETMNFVVAERMSFVDDYIRSYELDKECRKRIFPVYTPDPNYTSLQLREFSGAFTFLFVFFSFCFGVLLLEHIAIRFETKTMEKEEIVKSFEIKYLLIDETTEDAQRAKIFAKYLELLELIDGI
jgi:hypothetical protein